LKKQNINLDRKILAALAVHDKETFKKIVEKAKAA
jgi:large subunit ribosomal protein L20